MSRPEHKTLRRWRALADDLAAVVAEGGTPEHLAELRRSRTRKDPALFALVYLSKHLVDKVTDEVGLSAVHVDWAKSARSWMRSSAKPMADRRAEVAPRDMGKSTWWFLLLPMWAAAHQHRTFIAAFADSAPQAETHLASFKAELDDNALLRFDYPDLVHPKTRGRGTVAADRVSLYHARSGFVFAAAGADSSTLGMKIGDKRPDLLIIDDIEPHEGRYSAGQAAKRLDTLISAILPLNVRAAVVIAGTVTMHGSIVHQIVQWGRGERSEVNEWVGEQNITVRHTPAIVTGRHGQRKSVWPAKWPLAFLEGIEHTRPYAKNYANDPLGADGDYWAIEDIARANMIGLVPGITRTLVEVDPATTTKKSSDYTGIAVIGWSPSLNKVTVLEVRQVKKSGAALRLDVLDTIARHNAGLVRVETNQGGDLWRTIFWGMPCKVKTVHQSLPKEVRAAATLDHYQRGRVGHACGSSIDGKPLTLLDYEGQLVAFPNAPNDDMVDAAGDGIRYFLDRSKRVRAGGSNEAY